MNHDLERSEMAGENAAKLCTDLRTEKLEALALRLEQSGDYRVSRRLRPLAEYSGGPSSALRCAVILDTETTGTIVPRRPCAAVRNGNLGSQNADSAPSEVISLGLVAVAYELDTGRILGALDRLERLRQPSFPIPPEATAVHGIDDAKVEGCRIESVEISDWIVAATTKVQGTPSGGSKTRLPLIIAHNAGFDRRMVEAHWPQVFAPASWACSLVEIPWAQHGYQGTKLAYLGMKAGVHHDNHDALADAELLALVLQQDLGGRTAMAHLLDAARQTTHRVFAVGSPYDDRHLLKARGYRWNPGEDSRPRAWYRDCREATLTDELAFLDQRTPPSGAAPIIRVFGASERYSIRE